MDRRASTIAADPPRPDEHAALQMILQGTAAETGERFFFALVETLARALGDGTPCQVVVDGRRQSRHEISRRHEISCREHPRK